MADETSLSSRPLPDLIGGRYRIVSRLGVGGMGVVYKATDTQLNRSVAVKALEERRLHTPGASARLRTEALAAASLDHPYICKVYELVETPSDTFIVMEYIEGETLASMLKRGVLPLQQTLQLGREIAEGLANAHARGLVHRDVKPSNVMVTTHGHVKLLDFGVAGADVESAPKDVTRTLTPQLTVHAGTPQYMAPEQAAGNPISTRADLFSLGVLLYECLTAQLPFSGTTTFDYVRHVMQSPPRRLDRVAPDTPADLVDLIDRCLEKTPADRPESADAVVAALRRLEDALTSPTGDMRTARQARAGRRWKGVAALALLAAVVAIGWRFVWPPESDNNVSRQLRPFVTTSAAESDSQISPDGQWVSFLAAVSGSTRIMVQRVDGGEARPLTLGPGRPESQTWSPDGTEIATVFLLDGAYVLQVYPAFFGGAPVQSLPVGSKFGSVDLLRWIGRDVFLKTQDNDGMALQRLSLDSASAMSSLSRNWKIDGTLRHLDIRPDGVGVVMSVVKNGQEDLWTMNVDGSALRQLTADAAFDRHPRWIGQGDSVVFQSNRGGQIDLWQIDVRSKTLTALTSSDAEEIAEGTSPDGRVISYQQLIQDASIWMFGGPAGGGQQLTQDSLSDYSPALSGDGRVLAFQRSQPTPSSGYTFFDAKLFTSPFEGPAAVDAKPVVDGFAADLSHDGQWMAYLQVSDRPPRMTVSVRDLRGGRTIPITRTATPPVFSLSPVDWGTHITTWTAGSDLYFVDQPDVCVIRRYHPGDPSAGPAIVRAKTEREYFRDLYISPTTGALAYVSALPGAPALGGKPAVPGTVTVRELDLNTGTSRDLATVEAQSTLTSVYGRGWIDGQFVLVRRIEVHEDHSADLEVLLTTGTGGVRSAGRITHGFLATSRLQPARRVLYVTRAEKGTHNVYMFSLDTGSLAAVTQNTLPGVTFSGFQPAGSQGVIGVREERREDIWLLQTAPTPRPGASAGR